MRSQTRRQLGVCSWSGRPGSPDVLIERLQRLNIHRVQLALDPLLHDPAWTNAGARLAASGITIVSGMFETGHEDYRSPAAIRRTGGLVPDEAFTNTLGRLPGYLELMDQLRIEQVSFHAGFINPADEETFIVLLSRLQRIADIFRYAGKQLLLETGQETAASLLHTLATLSCPNVQINFDPGNLLLYNMGDPLDALVRLQPWIAQIHLKDAIASGNPEVWGEEKPAGEGQIDWARFFALLARGNYAGNLLIECESMPDPLGAIARARSFLEGHLA